MHVRSKAPRQASGGCIQVEKVEGPDQGWGVECGETRAGMGPPGCRGSCSDFLKVPSIVGQGQPVLSISQRKVG